MTCWVQRIMVEGFHQSDPVWKGRLDSFQVSLAKSIHTNFVSKMGIYSGPM